MKTYEKDTRTAPSPEKEEPTIPGTEKAHTTEDEDVREIIAKYLESQGWGVVLVAEHGVKGIDPDGYRYEYFMKFLGKQRESSELS